MDESEPRERAAEAAPRDAARRGSGPARVVKAVAFALLPLLALLLVSELVLWALDLGDPQERLTLSRGFSEEARYLVPDPEVPGGWVTQMYDEGIPEVRVGPRGDRLRVLMFGGSNTQSFPEQYLEEQLNAASPGGRQYEVINLGRAGYGSERVRILVTQAMALQPDIVFIYAGHNEFVERGFAMELIDAWRQPWLARAVDRLSRLRTLNVLVSLLEPRRPPPGSAVAGQTAGAAPLPEVRAQRGPDFSRLTYDKTLLFYDVYRQNLEAMISTAQAAGAQVMICTVIGNMLFSPMVAGTPAELSPEQLGTFRGRQRTGFELIPERMRLGILQTGPNDPPIRLTPRDWGDSIPREEREARRALGRNPVPPVLRPIAAPFDGGPYWTDPALWKPAVMELLPAVKALQEHELTTAERADVERAVGVLEEARAQCPTDALVLFGLGLCHVILGDAAQADRFLRDSARYDRAPTRGNDVTNGIVRELAAAHPEIAFKDAEELAKAACPGGLISYEIMMDNCHLFPAARRVLMDAFVPGLQQLGARATRH